MIKPKKTANPCMSCNGLGGKPLMIGPTEVMMCDECAPSEFRRGRVLERQREREAMP